MNCECVRRLISGYVDGELSGAQMLSIRDHLHGCAECGSEIEDIRQYKELMARLDSIASGATDVLTKEFIARTAFNFGVYFDRIGNRRSAFHSFKYALETDEDNPEYLLRLGAALYRDGRYGDAVKLLEQATKTGDGCPEAETLLRQIREKELSKR